MEDMYTGDCTYDIDNRDVEEEMIQQDIEEEEAQIEEEIAKEEEKEQQEIEKSYVKNRKMLTTKNLMLDLDRNEYDRTKYTWMKKADPSVSYSGIVVHRIDDDAFIFEVNFPDGKRLKKFKLSEIKQQNF